MQDGPPFRIGIHVIHIPTVEHLLPQCRGGTSDPENLVTACKSCNTAKRYRTVEEYREYLIKLTPEGQARDALRQFISERASVDKSVLKALDWIEREIQPIVFWGERQPLD